MADKAKDDAMRSNISDDTIWQFVEELDTLHEEHAQLQAKARTKNGQIRQCRKRAKEAGVDLEVLDATLAEKKEEEDRRREKLATAARYQTLLGLPTTLDLSKAIQAEMEFTAPDEATQQRIDRRDAMQDGLDAGKSGVDRGANPFQTGTLAYQAWDSGWIQGNETRLALAKDESQPRPRRGRRRAAPTETPESEPAEAA